MAQARRSPQHKAPSSSTSSPSRARKKHLPRRSPPKNRRAPGASRYQSSTSHAPHALLSSPPDHRSVLAPLHPNLRRLPSRLYLAQKDTMPNPGTDTTQVGSKRKRVASANENTVMNGRSTRGRSKRLKGSSGNAHGVGTDDEDEEASSMEVDTPTWTASDESEPEEVEEDEGDHDDDSTDDYLLNSAPTRQLQRLRKDELARLFATAGLTDDPDDLTKLELAEAIINARDDEISVPPSSPPGPTDGNSSGYSSDEGNVAGDEETDAGGLRYPHAGSSPLKRRATTNDINKPNARSIKGRSLSLGHLLRDTVLVAKKGGNRGSIDERRKTSNRSSPTTSSTTSTVSQSPPATRLRSRKTSAPVQLPTPISTGSSGGFPHNKGSVPVKAKGKAKQVEFSQEVESIMPSGKRGGKEKEQKKEPSRPLTPDDESDLTELDELEESLSAARCYPSPRRLRSKDHGRPEPPEPSSPRRKRKQGDTQDEHDVARRTPMRKAKAKAASLKDDDDDDEAEEVEQDQSAEESAEEEDELEEEEESIEQEEEQEEDDEEGEEQEQEEDEVDELVSSTSASPPASEPQRTPVRRRLRARGKSHSSESDEDEQSEHAEEADDGDVDGEGEGDDEETIAVEPRKLRNGKIVGDDDIDMDVEEDIGEEDEEDEEEEGGEDEEQAEETAEESEENAEVEVEEELEASGGSEEDEAMEEEVDLAIATAKTLVRLRRDDLIRLCETRDLEPVGTKPQLAEALLQWRDRHATGFSSPSSAGTVRPPSTVKRGRRRAATRTSQDSSPPVLLREHVHYDEPRTPPPSHQVKEPEPELELDLESLGLEDREIPPEKLQKLEKIGSGGFKDVFIGKLKGRKIAISEFRGQLSAMDIKELKLLGGFDHQNIVRFLGVSIPENTRETPVMIVSELCANGDLFDYIRNVNAPSLRKVLSLMLDIARGLEYLHLRKPSVIHRDCKSSNILITTKGVAKIADFGLAKVKQSTRSMVRSLVGTVNWQAPELWHAHPKYNHKVDVFSCAMVYWEMLQWHQTTKKFPWEGMNEHAIYEIVGSKRQRPSISGLRKQWCPEVVDLVEQMWAHEHTDRPTMSEVVRTLEELYNRY
ncbi:hypothetical protein BDN72DRAFT_784825 [Pluteus cervinus]|uniref:Uncharacterized protein n=1 Tax=Pluteus cervinus TaxID=181527 RepID=A0ACD3BDE8_9AGAR|nr:hypothetical protein BDN72DRAFT_784825 [Pluteus cervinus]